MLQPTMSHKEKTPKAPRLVQAAVRVPQSVVDEYEGFAEQINKAAGWEKVTRSDLMRDDLLAALSLRRTGDVPNLREAIAYLKPKGAVSEAAIGRAREVAKQMGDVSAATWLIVLHDLDATEPDRPKKR